MIKNKKFDLQLFLAWFFLVSFGVISIYSASVTTLADYVEINNFWLKQLVFFIIVIPVMYLVLKIPYYIIDHLIIPGYLFSILLLLIVLFTPEINGSHRWINLGGFNLQPSEFAKLLTILTIAKTISRPQLSEIKIITYGLLVNIVPVALIMLEPDFGTTLVFWVSLISMYLAAGIPFTYLFLMISPIIALSLVILSPIASLAFICLFAFILYKWKFNWLIQCLSFISNVFASILFWQILKPYQISRILTFIDPTRDPLGAGYQVIQAKIAIGSGGLYGKGFLNGTQKNLDFLPEHHTDFIFSVIGEEMGFIFSAFLLLLFFFLLWRIIKSIDKILVPERKIASVGIFTYILFQVFVNIGMNIGIVPTTGVPLPFISYGGSNLMINSLSIAFIQKYLVEKGFLK